MGVLRVADHMMSSKQSTGRSDAVAAGRSPAAKGEASKRPGPPGSAALPRSTVQLQRPSSSRGLEVLGSSAPNRWRTQSPVYGASSSGRSFSASKSSASSGSGHTFPPVSASASSIPVSVRSEIRSLPATHSTPSTPSPRNVLRVPSNVTRDRVVSQVDERTQEQVKAELERQKQKAQVAELKLDTANHDLRQRDKAISRLRDENDRLRHSQSEGITVQALGQQLAVILKVSIPSTATLDEIATVVTEQVLLKSQNEVRLTFQVSELNSSIEHVCSKLAEEQVLLRKSEEELRQTRRNLSEQQKENEEIKDQISSRAEELARTTAQLEVLKALQKGLEARAEQAEEQRAHSEAQKTLAEGKLPDLSQKASELERKQEQLETERTEATREAAHHREELEEFVRKIKTALDLEASASQTDITDKASALLKDLDLCSQRLSVLDASCEDSSTELKASRETIKRLAAQLKDEQDAAREQQQYMTNLKIEQEELRAKLASEDVESELLQRHLCTGQQSLDAAKELLGEKENEVESLRVKWLKLEQQMSTLEEELAETVSQVDGRYRPESPDKYSNMEKLVLVVQTMNEKAKLWEQTESALRQEINQQKEALQREQEVTGRLREELHTSQTGETKADEAYQELQEAYHRHEAALRANYDKHSASLSEECDRRFTAFSAFCKRMCEALDLDQEAMDFSDGKYTDQVFERVKSLRQLQAGEAEKNATITTLRQKLKTVKTKLDNKKLEAQAMEIMIEDLQESLREAEAKSAETKSLAEKLKRTEKALRKQETRQLEETTARLDAAVERTLPIQKENRANRSKIWKLERLLEEAGKEKKAQDLKAQELLGQVERAKAALVAGKKECKSEVDAMKSDLSRTTSLYNEVSKHERQLLSFRNAVAAILGLNTTLGEKSEVLILRKVESLIRYSATLSRDLEQMRYSAQEMQARVSSAVSEQLDFAQSASQEYSGHLRQVWTTAEAARSHPFLQNLRVVRAGPAPPGLFKESRPQSAKSGQSGRSAAKHEAVLLQLPDLDTPTAQWM